MNASETIRVIRTDLRQMNGFTEMIRQIQPLTTVVSIIDAVSTVTPFIVPLSPDIERPVMQAQDFSNCRLARSRGFLTSFRLLASSPAPMLSGLSRGFVAFPFARPCSASTREKVASGWGVHVVAAGR